jgi:hypothetical protein
MNKNKMRDPHEPVFLTKEGEEPTHYTMPLTSSVPVMSMKVAEQKPESEKSSAKVPRKETSR